MKQELELCPFCRRGFAKVKSHHDGVGTKEWVECTSCAATGPRWGCKNAADGWNNRAQDARVQLLAKALQTVPISHPRAVVIGAKDGQQVCLNGELLMQALAEAGIKTEHPAADTPAEHTP